MMRGCLKNYNLLLYMLVRMLFGINSMIKYIIIGIEMFFLIIYFILYFK